MKDIKIVAIDNFALCDEKERKLKIKNNIVRYVVREYLGGTHYLDSHPNTLSDNLPKKIIEHDGDMY